MLKEEVDEEDIAEVVSMDQCACYKTFRRRSR